MTPVIEDGRADDRDLPSGVVDDLLGDPRRRRLLSHLAERGEPVALTDLAAAVHAAETGTDPPAVPSERRQTVREDILEHHLPKLTATGVVEYDSMQGTVSLRSGPVADRVA